jgi:hypothetical protein
MTLARGKYIGMLVGKDVADEADHFFQMYRMRLLDQHARSWRGARSRRVAAASRSGSTAMKTPRDIADRSRELARLFASWRATAFCARPSRSLSMTHARRLQNSERISGRRLHDCRGEPGASFPTARSNSRCGGCRRRIESRGKRRLTFATSISFDSASPILMNAAWVRSGIRCAKAKWICSCGLFQKCRSQRQQR